MKDFLGQDLAVGDHVVFIIPNYRFLTKGVIASLSPKMAIIDRIVEPGMTVHEHERRLKQFYGQIVKYTP